MLFTLFTVHEQPNLILGQNTGFCVHHFADSCFVFHAATACASLQSPTLLSPDTVYYNYPFQTPSISVHNPHIIFQPSPSKKVHHTEHISFVSKYYNFKVTSFPSFLHFLSGNPALAWKLLRIHEHAFLMLIFHKLTK